MKHILSTLAFYAKHEGWHTYSTDMKQQIKSLENRGYLRVSWLTNQAKYTGKVFA